MSAPERWNVATTGRGPKPVAASEGPGRRARERGRCREKSCEEPRRCEPWPREKARRAPVTRSPRWKAPAYRQEPGALQAGCVDRPAFSRGSAGPITTTSSPLGRVPAPSRGPGSGRLRGPYSGRGIRGRFASAPRLPASATRSGGPRKPVSGLLDRPRIDLVSSPPSGGGLRFCRPAICL